MCVSEMLTSYLTILVLASHTKVCELYELELNAAPLLTPDQHKIKRRCLQGPSTTAVK